jgi:hypothetical protein
MMTMKITEALTILQAPKYIAVKLQRCNELYEADCTIAEPFSQLNKAKMPLIPKRNKRNFGFQSEEPNPADAVNAQLAQLKKLQLKWEFADNLAVILEWLGGKWQELIATIMVLHKHAKHYEEASLREIEQLKIADDTLKEKIRSNSFDYREGKVVLKAGFRAGYNEAERQLTEPTDAQAKVYVAHKRAILTIESATRFDGSRHYLEPGEILADAHGNVRVDADGNLVNWQANANAKYCPKCDHVLFNGKCFNPKCPSVGVITTDKAGNVKIDAKGNLISCK